MFLVPQAWAWIGEPCIRLLFTGDQKGGAIRISVLFPRHWLDTSMADMSPQGHASEQSAGSALRLPAVCVMNWLRSHSCSSSRFSLRLAHRTLHAALVPRALPSFVWRHVVLDQRHVQSNQLAGACKRRSGPSLLALRT